jgi:hypothetical protein
MSIFAHRMPAYNPSYQSLLAALQNTLKSFRPEPVETAQTADLKRIRANRHRRTGSQNGVKKDTLPLFLHLFRPIRLSNR